MPRQANWNYLINAIKKDDEKFKVLCEWFFGGDPTIEKCAEYAYRDLQRNLRGIGKMNENEKEQYKAKVVVFIKDQIDKLLELKLSKAGDQLKHFDAWHKETCSGICDISDSINKHLENKFSYGLAQKWLNMTLKNMLVAETAEWYKELDKIRKPLHVPVDNYIRDAAHDMLGIRGTTKGRFERNISWDKWNEDIYKRFQEAVREAIECRGDYNCPIDWEFDAWLFASK